jgi:hypothetical protein
VSGEKWSIVIWQIKRIEAAGDRTPPYKHQQTFRWGVSLVTPQCIFSMAHQITH